LNDPILPVVTSLPEISSIKSSISSPPAPILDDLLAYAAL